MKVAVVVPIWQRPALTRLCLSYWSRWDADVNFCAVISDPADGESVPAPWDILIAPNEPLGAKFNAGIQFANLCAEPDYVMVMGSDVLVRDSIFADYLPHMEAGVPFIGVYDTYIYDAPTAKAYYWPGYGQGKTAHRKGQVIGPGRLYSRELLDSVGWRPYPDERNRDLDGGADAHLPEPVGIWAKDHGMLSIKTGDQITPLRSYLRSGAYEVPTAHLHYEGADFTQL